MQQFKVTLNKPAFDHFFKGQEYGGIQVEILNNRVRFKPVLQSSGPGVIAITERARGGIETRLIEGSESDKLWAAFSHPPEIPFFMLERVADGWVEAKPWLPSPEALKTSGRPEPERFTPHLRVWPKANVRVPTGEIVYDSFPEMDLEGRAAETVRSNLRMIQQALTNIDTLPLGEAFVQVQRIQDLINQTHDPLLAAARAEAAAQIGQNSAADAETKPARAKAEKPKVEAKAEPVKVAAEVGAQAEAPKAQPAPAAAPAGRAARMPSRIKERIASTPSHRPLRGMRLGVRA